MCHMSHQIALDEDTETSPPPVLLSGASVDKRVGETQNNSFFFFFSQSGTVSQPLKCQVDSPSVLCPWCAILKLLWWSNTLLRIFTCKSYWFTFQALSFFFIKKRNNMSRLTRNLFFKHIKTPSTHPHLCTHKCIFVHQNTNCSITIYAW